MVRIPIVVFLNGVYGAKMRMAEHWSTNHRTAHVAFIALNSNFLCEIWKLFILYLSVGLALMRSS